MWHATSFSYSSISFSGNDEANHISVTSLLVGLVDSVILDKKNKISKQRFDLAVF